jgi:hypothetical protein
MAQGYVVEPSPSLSYRGLGASARPLVSSPSQACADIPLMTNRWFRPGTSVVGRLLATFLAIPTFLALGARTATASPPPNDDFDQATVVSALPFTNEVDTTGASQASDDPTETCGGWAARSLFGTSLRRRAI